MKESSRERRDRERRRYMREFELIRHTETVDGNGTTQLESFVEVPEREPYTPLADGKLARRSTLVDSQGGIIQTWQIEKPEVRAAELYLEAIAEELSHKLVKAEPVDQEKIAVDAADMLAVYPVGDLHLGGYSWAAEAGDDWDIDIAERYLQRAGQILVGLVPPCEHALIEFLGDFEHYDSMVPVTPAHANKLDADTRAQRMARIAIRAANRLIREALLRHQHVHVIFESGNHDEYGSRIMREWLAFHYADEPRVTVDTSPQVVHYYEFGNNLIGTHHGDKIKMEDLPMIMANDQKEAWGRTLFRYWHTGHIHHSTKRMPMVGQDIMNVWCESFRVLGPTDAWAQGVGHRTQSIRDLRAIMMHKEYGQVGQFQVNPLMLKGVFDA